MQRRKSRVKVIVFISFVTLTALCQSYLSLGLAVLLLLGLMFSTKKSLSYYRQRLVWLIPFALMLVILYPFITPGQEVFQVTFGPMVISATLQGLLKAGLLFLRVLTAMLAGLLFLATTSVSELLQALRDLKVPVVLLAMLEFTIRYSYVLTDEVQRMQTARKSRGFVRGQSLFRGSTLKILGQLIGVLFVRALERGERIYQAMLARGYDFSRGK